MAKSGFVRFVLFLYELFVPEYSFFRDEFVFHSGNDCFPFPVEKYGRSYNGNGFYGISSFIGFSRRYFIGINGNAPYSGRMDDGFDVGCRSFVAVVRLMAGYRGQ